MHADIPGAGRWVIAASIFFVLQSKLAQWGHLAADSFIALDGETANSRLANSSRQCDAGRLGVGVRYLKFREV